MIQTDSNEADLNENDADEEVREVRIQESESIDDNSALYRDFCNSMGSEDSEQWLSRVDWVIGTYAVLRS
jgi:hypothetical protein